MNKRIIVTRSSKDNKEFISLVPNRFNIESVPCISFKSYLSQNIKNIEGIKNIVFTSTNALIFLTKNYKIKEDFFDNKNIYSVGRKVIGYIKNNFTIKNTNFEHFKDSLELIKEINRLKNPNYLYICVKDTLGVIEQNINQSIKLQKLITYETILNNISESIKKNINLKQDTFIFIVFSISAVKALISNFSLLDLKHQEFIVIGQTTANFLKDRGFKNIYTAKNHNSNHIIEILDKLM